MASIAVFTAVSNPIVYSVHAISRSIVPGRPIVLIPSVANFCAPLKEPSPPITTNPSIPCFLQMSAAFFCTSGSMNSKHLAVCKIVPPRWMISDTLCASISMISSCKSPAYPRLIPLTFLPLAIACRTTARMAAFIPGASPPLVKTPIVCTSFAIVTSSYNLIHSLDLYSNIFFFEIQHSFPQLLHFVCQKSVIFSPSHPHLWKYSNLSACASSP